jgi:hypothetical protein
MPLFHSIRGELGMTTRVSRVIQEYVLWTDAVQYGIRGRIVEHLDADPKERYGWEVSHHFKPAKSAFGVYRPSAVTGASLEEVTGQLIAYLRGFQNINVEPNSRY